MATTPPNPPPFDPTNRNDPRYDPRRDPRSTDPNWQRAYAASTRAQAKAWQEQQKYAARQQRDAARAYARQVRDNRRAVRRASAPSLIGPLVLIAIAVAALLVHNGRISLPGLLTWYARWWPAILIGIGVVRLLEWAVDHYTRRDTTAPVRYTLGGGVVTLTIFIVLFGISAQGGLHHNGNNWNFGFNSDDWKQWVGSKHEQDTPAASHTIAANGALIIDNPHGDVTVSGISDDGLLHLSTHKEVYTNSDDQARDRLASLEPQFSGSNDNLTLHVNAADTGETDLTLLVPPTVRVSINANHGDVKANNLKTPTSLTANHGDVDVAAITGPVTVHVNSRGKSVTAHSISGPVNVQGTGDELNLSDVDGPVTVDGDFFGGGRLLHITGPIRYNTTRISFNLARLDGEVSFDDKDEFSADDAAGPFTLKTRSRDLTLNHIAGNVDITNSHGKVELQSTGGTITVANHDGDIRLSLPQQAKFTLAAETSDGDVTNNFGLGSAGGGRGILNGSVGGGTTPVHLTTTHGDISVDHTGDSTPTPPRPRPTLKLGFGTVPPPPPPPGALPPEAAQAIANARQQVLDSQQQVKQALRDATQQTAEGRREADQARREALREAEQSRRDAQQELTEALREAEQSRQEALRETGEARRQGLQQAEEARRQAQQQAAEALREAEEISRQAQQQADQARRDALRQAEEARRQAQQQSHPNN